MNKQLYFALFLLQFALAGRAQVPDNPELQKMYDEDQRSRSVSDINWVELSMQDSLRQVRVY